MGSVLIAQLACGFSLIWSERNDRPSLRWRQLHGKDGPASSIWLLRGKTINKIYTTSVQRLVLSCAKDIMLFFSISTFTWNKKRHKALSSDVANYLRNLTFRTNYNTNNFVAYRSWFRDGPEIKLNSDPRAGLWTWRWSCGGTKYYAVVLWTGFNFYGEQASEATDWMFV